MSEAPKKVKVLKDEMERINKNMKLYRALGVPEDEVLKYLYDCIKAYGEQELKEQDQSTDLNEPEQDCYGDGNVYRGVRSKDSNIKTIFFSSNSEPARKPMNGDELLEGFDAAECSGLRSFTEGVRWAEEFHGIGVEEE